MTMMDDDHKLMPRSRHVQQKMAMTTSVPIPQPFEPANTTDGGVDFLSCGGVEDREERGECASTHGSPPKMPFNNNFFAVAGSGSEMKRPVALRPSSRNAPAPPALRLGPPLASEEPSRGGRLPTFRVALDEDTGVLQVPSSALDPLRKGKERLPNVPQLRIRPIPKIKKEVKLSSPLARRGAAERAYLQGQLKAEALRRRKQDQHNEQRKLRENAGELKDENIPNGISSMIEKLNLRAPEDHEKLVLKKDLREFASSPPPILKATFKRSVSAVLEDSGIHEDTNLLFFPDGVPLSESLDCCEERRSSLDNDDQSVDASENRSLSQESSEDELSPSLIAADVIWQLGSNLPLDLDVPPNRGNKKVTLRPKMAPKKSEAQFSPIKDSNMSNSISPLEVPSKRASQEEQDRSKFKTPDKFDPCGDDMLAASESFQQLSFDHEVDLAESINSHDKQKCHPEGRGSTTFSSPEAGFNYQTYKGRTLGDMLKEPLSDSNYRTPDNSEHQKPRRLLRQRMPKLPELGLPDMSDPDAQVCQGKAAMAVQEEGEEEEEIAFELVLKNPTHLYESNYCTPEHGSYRKKLDDGMPKMPDFNAIGSTSGYQESLGKASLALLDVTAREETFTPELLSSGLLLKQPLSESNFCTPDNSERSKVSSRKQPMLKLPEIRQADMDENYQSQIHDRRPQDLLDQAFSPPSEEGHILQYRDALRTPC